MREDRAVRDLPLHRIADRGAPLRLRGLDALSGYGGFVTLRVMRLGLCSEHACPMDHRIDALRG